jgi:hypothetical protein
MTITVIVTVSTNQGNGTIRGVIVPHGSNPSIPQIKAGQKGDGTPAFGSTTKNVIATGNQVMPAMSGIPEQTSLDAVLVHTNSAGFDSNVVTFPFTSIGSGTGATAVVMSGPSSGIVGSPLTFTVQLNGVGAARFDPTKTVSSGTFSPTFLNLSNTSPQSFTFTPGTAGVVNISGTNDAGLINPTPIPVTVAAAGAVQGPKSSLGWNHEQAAYVSVDMPFTDIKAESSPWRIVVLSDGSSGGYPLAADLDSLGWPTVLHAGTHISTVMMQSTAESVPYPSGDYLVVVQGCTLTWGRDAFIVAPQAGDAPDVQRVRVATPTMAGMEARITALTGGPVRFKVCLPYVAANGIDPHTITRTTFNPEHLAKLTTSGCIRFMDRLVTNNYNAENDLYYQNLPPNFDQFAPPPTFAEWRTPVDAATYVCDDWDFSHTISRSGRTNLRWPLEVCCAIANQLQTRPWFNLPHTCVSHSSVPTANDAFTLAYAQVVKDNLDPTLAMYVEYSNEPWNPAFWQNNYIIQCGQLRPEGPIGMYEQIGEASRQVGNLFKTIIPANRVINMLNCRQSPAAAGASAALPYLEAKYGRANIGIDSITMAPYLGDLYEVEGDITTPGTARYFENPAPPGPVRQDAGDRGQFEYLTGLVKEHTKWANAYNIGFAAYEGGEGTYAKDTVDQNLFVPANKIFQRNPLMKQLMIDWLQHVWKENGGEMFAFYLFAGHIDRNGHWGALESVREVRSAVPKYDGVMTYADANIVPYWTGQAAAELMLPGGRYIISDSFIPKVRTTQRLGTINCTVVPHDNFAGLTIGQIKAHILAGTNASGGPAIYHEAKAATSSGLDILFNATTILGLTPSTDYDAWFMQDNGLGGITNPVMGVARTVAVGTGIVLTAINDNLSGATPYNQLGTFDRSPYNKEFAYRYEDPNSGSNLCYTTDYGAPVGMLTTMKFDSVGALYLQPNNDFAFPGDFMITWVQLAHQANFRLIWDMRTSPSDPLLSCGTDGAGAIVIRKGGVDILVASGVTVGIDTWRLYQLVRRGTSLTLWGGTPGGALTNLGSIVDTTSYGRASFQFGKDIAGAGAFWGQACCIEIQKSTTVGGGVMPALPLGSTAPPPTGETDVIEFLLFNEQSTDIFGQVFDDQSPNNFGLAPTIAGGRPAWDNTFAPVYSSGYPSSVIFGSNSATMNGSSLTHLALGDDDFCFRGTIMATSSGAALGCGIYDGRLASGGAQPVPCIYMYLNELRFHVNGLDRILSVTPMAPGWHNWAIARVAGVTRMFIDQVKVGADYPDTNHYTAPAYPIIGDFVSGGNVLLGSMACFELVRNPSDVAHGKYVTGGFPAVVLPLEGGGGVGVGATLEMQALNEEGGDASTDFVDEAPVPSTLTASNPGVRPAWSNSTAPTGMATAPVFGSDHVAVTAGPGPSLPAKFSFAAAEDFCIRFRFILPGYIIGAEFASGLIDLRDPTSDHIAMYLANWGSASIFMWHAPNVGDTNAGSIVTGDTWHAAALARIGGIYRFFLNGIQRGPDVPDTSVIVGAYPFTLGNLRTHDPLQAHPGSIAAFQIVRNPQTIPQGRYEANYTPEAVPYP